MAVDSTLHAKIGEHDAQIEALNTSVGEVRKAVHSLDLKIDSGFQAMKSSIDSINAQGNSNNQFRSGQLAVWAGLILTAVFSIGSLVMNLKDSHIESERNHMTRRIDNLDITLQREIKLNDDRIEMHVEDAMATYISKYEANREAIGELKAELRAMAAEDRAELRELKHERIFNEESKP